MSDLANSCYQRFNDAPDEINRYFGFYRQEKAAQAKVEIAQSLTGLIRAAHGTVEGKISPMSSRWWYDTDFLTALVNGTELEITIGAKHNRKATKSLPCVGIFSELVLSIFTYDNAQQFMQSNLAEKMKGYLSSYGTSRII